MRHAILLSGLLLFLLFSPHIYSQDKNVVQLDGYVRADSMRAIPFSHIFIKGTFRGTVCDFWGYYSLVAETGDTLIFSSVGYKTKYKVLSEDLSASVYSLDIYLQKDTIELEEVNIFPWKNYEQFKVVFLNTDIQDDDLDRAKRNLAILKKQMQYDDYISDASLNYKYYLKEHYNQLYYAGQVRPMSIFDVMAWSQFFKAIKEGQFSRENNRNEDDDDYWK